VTLDNGDTPHLLDRFYKGDFNMAFGTIKGIDPSEELQDRLTCGAGRNNSKYCNPAVDEALRVGQESTDLATRKAAYRTVEEAIWTDVPFLLYSRLTVRTAAQDYVKGLEVFGGGDVDVATVWLDK
jgi:peptide/nickel transport system substrate-binding protein